MTKFRNKMNGITFSHPSQKQTNNNNNYNSSLNVLLGFISSRPGEIVMGECILVLELVTY